MRIEIDLEFTEQNCIDTLTTAVESGIEYWVERFMNIKRDKEKNIVEVTIEYFDEDDEIKKSVLTSGTIRHGIRKMFQRGFDVRLDLKQQLLEEEPCADADCADCIIQAALFGELVYG